MCRIPLRWRRGVQLGVAVSVAGRIWVHGNGRVRIGDRVRLDARRAPIELHAGPAGEIVIGDDVAIEGGVSIEAQESVTIGHGCRIAAFCKIIDNHYHPLRGDRHHMPPSVPVVLEPGVDLGTRAIVLAGARVPVAAVVPPGAVIRGPPPVSRRAPHAPGLEVVSAADARDPRLTRALRRFRVSPGAALLRVLALLRAQFALRGCECGGRTTVYGRLDVENAGTIRIGSGVTFVGGMIPSTLFCHPGAVVEVGDECVFNYAASIEARASVRIGRGCLFASFVRLSDGARNGPAPLTIGDGVWIAHGAIIEAGVTIGDGSVVAAGSVVTRDVPPGSIAAGNPARIMSLALADPEQATEPRH